MRKRGHPLQPCFEDYLNGQEGADPSRHKREHGLRVLISETPPILLQNTALPVNRGLGNAWCPHLSTLPKKQDWLLAPFALKLQQSPNVLYKMSSGALPAFIPETQSPLKLYLEYPLQ